MDEVGQLTTACKARRQARSLEGCCSTNDCPLSVLPKISDASSRQVSHSMQVESTNSSPGSFWATASWRCAMLLV
jgi:hypothetical protein